MPLYEFKCTDCGEEFEMMARFSEANHSPTCPTCLGLNTRKKISTIASRWNSLGGAAVTSGGSCAPRGGFS